jgi:hypothetical protein
MDRLTPYNVTILRKTSEEASKIISDGSLDFVYIDALHEFDPFMLDLLLWSPKVKLGGIVAGHDYVHNYQYGVIQAVEAFVRGRGIGAWYITRERQPSFFWVKRH